MSRVDYAAQAAAHIEEAIVANQNGKWETARFELKLAEVKAILALSDPTEKDKAESDDANPGPTPTSVQLAALSREAFARARAGRS